MNRVLLASSGRSRKECSPLNRPGMRREPRQRSSSWGRETSTVGRKRMLDLPGGMIWTLRRAPSRNGPLMERMNGFQAGKALKSVSTCHTREGGAEIRMLASISCCAIGNQPLQRFIRWRCRGRNKRERSGMRPKVESEQRQLETALALYLDHDPTWSEADRCQDRATFPTGEALVQPRCRSAAR